MNAKYVCIDLQYYEKSASDHELETTGSKYMHVKLTPTPLTYLE